MPEFTFPHHARQVELTNHYRAARATWRVDPSARAAARSLAMDEREFCERFVMRNFGRLLAAEYTDLPNGELLDYDRAFDDAADESERAVHIAQLKRDLLDVPSE